VDLVLRREQRSSVMGNAVFSLEVRATITPEERANIARYKLGKAVLYSRDTLADPGKGLLGLATRAAFKAMNIAVTIDDLAGGKRIECKDILEMLAVEGQIKEAAVTFKQVLEAAAHFGGDEVLAI
jgi:hypothetical protein